MLTKVIFLKEQADVEVPKVKSTFTVRIMSYEKDKKTTLIKEIRNYMEGMNLAQVSLKCLIP